MSDDLFQAILAMDAYNRGYNAGLNISGNQIGNATVGTDSSILLSSTGQRLDQASSFFAQSYTLANGQTVISYRGTDNTAFFNPGSDIWSGWITGAGVYASPQAELAAQFYQAINGGNASGNQNIILTGHSLGGGLAPGMAVTVEIKTGTRRIIEYLMSPVLRYRQESLRER